MSERTSKSSRATGPINSFSSACFPALRGVNTEFSRSGGRRLLKAGSSRVLHYSFQSHTTTTMLLSREYVGYLARQLTQKLAAGDFIESKDLRAVSDAVNTAMLEELQLEDRINEEVRLILEQYQDEMRRAGASYQEMFKKVKGELVRKYKAVL